MQMEQLWNDQVEKQFLQQSLKQENHSFPEKLFYYIGHKYYVYIPKHIKSPCYTLQSGNALIGRWTEQCCHKRLAPIASRLNLYAVTDVICQSAGLSKQSSADIAFCASDKKHQKYQNIKFIGYEIDKNYVQRAEERIKSLQLALFPISQEQAPSL